MEAVSNSAAPEDYKAHQDLLRMVISVQNIQVEKVCKKSHKLLDILALGSPSRVGVMTD